MPLRPSSGSFLDDLYNQALSRIPRGTRLDHLAHAPGEAVGLVGEKLKATGQAAWEGIDPLVFSPKEAVHGARDFGRFLLEDDSPRSAVAPDNPFPNMMPRQAAPEAPKPVLPNLGQPAEPEPTKAAAPAADSFFNRPPRQASEPEYAGLRAGAYQGSPGFQSDGSIRDFVLNDQARQFLAGSAEGEGFLAQKRREMEEAVRGAPADPAERALRARMQTLAAEQMMPAGASPRMRHGVPGGLMEEYEQEHAGQLPTVGQVIRNDAQLSEIRTEQERDAAKLRGETERDIAVARATEEAKAASKFGALDKMADDEEAAQIAEVLASNAPDDRKAATIKNIQSETREKKERNRLLGLAPNSYVPPGG
jgi:hypothetical protein